MKNKPVKERIGDLEEEATMYKWLNATLVRQNNAITIVACIQFLIIGALVIKYVLN